MAISLELVQAIKHYNSEAQIDFVTTPQASEIIKLSPLVTEIFQFDKRNKHKRLKSISEFANSIQKNHLDCIISLHRSFRTSYLVSKLQSRLKIGFSGAGLGFLVYDVRVKVNYSENEHYRVLTPLKTFGINYDNYKIGQYQICFSNFVTEQSEKIIKENNLNNNFIVIAPGSVWETKKWGKENYLELVKKFEKQGENIVLIGSTEDKTDTDYIASQSSAINLAGKTNISEVMYLISKAKMVVSNDSAPIHFANLVNTPVIAIFGPTSPIFGFAPIGKNDKVIENQSIKCRPCQIHGGKKCPLGTLECMNSIKSEMVFNEAVKFL